MENNIIDLSTSNLYSLPKDMLIKLISAIRQTTINEFNEKLKNKRLNSYKCDLCGGYYSILHDLYFITYLDDKYFLEVCCANCYSRRKDINEYPYKSFNKAEFKEYYMSLEYEGKMRDYYYLINEDTEYLIDELFLEPIEFA